MATNFIPEKGFDLTAENLLKPDNHETSNFNKNTTEKSPTKLKIFTKILQAHSARSLSNERHSQGSRIFQAQSLAVESTAT